MAASRSTKASFAAGELAPELYGRSDLRAYENGARRLRNVFIQPTGGVTRRPGLRHVAMLAGPARLIAFEFNTEQTYLIALTHELCTVFMSDVPVASFATPWTQAHLPLLGVTQSADTLLVVHPEVPPKRITRTSHTSWTLGDWILNQRPFHRFADPAITLHPGATTGAITLTASAPVFAAAHLGTEFRVGGRIVALTGITDAQTATANVVQELTSADATADWEEAAFSPVRGWPATVCFHQDRLVIGGSRDLPNRLWLSKSGDLFNFDQGSGLDDESIEFALVSDQVNAIRAVFSGRHLQVFTSGAEWMVSGDPLTPANIQLNRQTRVGSPVDRTIAPVDVDGSTIFVARTGGAVHEFAYTDVQQAYQANDLAIVARHLVGRPVSMAYDQTRRLLHVVMDDGSCATLTLYRAEQVTAWTRQETDGAFRAVAEIEGSVYAAIERAGTTRLERFDPAMAFDAGIAGSAATPRDTWTGLDHLNGRAVGLLADGAPRGSATVSAGGVVLDLPCLTLQAGLPFTHVIEPLPPALSGQYGARSAPLRLVSVDFRVLETAALAADIGRGMLPVPLRRLDTGLLDAAPPRVTGDITLRALGWRRDATRPLWRIEGSDPLPMTLLSVTTAIRITN